MQIAVSCRRTEETRVPGTMKKHTKMVSIVDRAMRRWLELRGNLFSNGNLRVHPNANPRFSLQYYNNVIMSWGSLRTSMRSPSSELKKFSCGGLNGSYFNTYMNSPSLSPNPWLRFAGIVGLLLEIERKLRDRLYPSIVSMATEYFCSGCSQNQLNVAGTKIWDTRKIDKTRFIRHLGFSRESHLWLVSVAAYWILMMNLHLEWCVRTRFKLQPLLTRESIPKSMFETSETWRIPSLSLLLQDETVSWGRSQQNK